MTAREDIKEGWDLKKTKQRPRWAETQRRKEKDHEGQKLKKGEDMRLVVLVYIKKVTRLKEVKLTAWLKEAKLTAWLKEAKLKAWLKEAS